jgi:uncharacterized membrane protein YfcA
MELTFISALLLITIGLGIGAISGMVGIGGGVLVIPALMILFGFTQQKANGTSLAMLLPPIGILAVLSYARAGNVNWVVAGLLALGFFFGAHFGAWIVNRGWIHPTAMRLTFALFLIYVAASLLFRTGGRARAALETSLMVGGFALTYTLMRLLGRKWMKTPSWSETYRNKLRYGPYDYEI